MPSRHHDPGCEHRQPLTAGWSMCQVAPGKVALAQDIPEAAWQAIAEAAPVAAALRASGQWTLDAAARRFDAEEWWYRTHIEVCAAQAGLRRSIEFGGLATLCEVWLDGRSVLVSDNMFLAHEVVLDEQVTAGEHELVLCFRALDAALARRKPRPRWRTPMVEHQQLRWWRTSLLGRTPGWSPPCAVVGPWRPIAMVQRSVAALHSQRLDVSVAHEQGIVDAACTLATFAPSTIESATLELSLHGVVIASMPLSIAAPPVTLNTPHPSAREPQQHRLTGRLTLARPALWWPHTHGTSPLYEARLQVRVRNGADNETHPIGMDLGRIGFRRVEADLSDGRFSLRVNGVPVFCRGAIWTPLDPVQPDAKAHDIHAMLEQVRSAGMNMVRVGGTNVYESDAFLDACDALGMLVWQDFMFANMDYPAEDTGFLASTRAEAEQELARWQGHPCLAVLCGNSEVEQHAAMWGAPRASWASSLFHQTLAELAREQLPNVPYWPSSAHGGAFPHQGDRGTTSYYGVGAYLRDYADARTADLSFATECLAFANLPHDTTLSRMPGGTGVRVHHPAWKQRSPRDLGAGWDFDDVRDHYLAQEFRLDPMRLRYADPERYMLLGRLATGRAMAAAFAHWRRPASRCGGALVLFLRDLWAGAGWGLFDDQGVAKACLHLLAPLLAPVAIWLTDEGGNGVAVHVCNDRGEALAGDIELTVLRPNGTPLTQARRAIALDAHAAHSFNALEGFEEFIDLSCAYRFGAAGVAAIVAKLFDVTGQRLSQNIFYPDGEILQVEPDISASARLTGEGYVVTLASAGLAQAVHFEAEGYVASTEFFDLAPGEQREVVMRACTGYTRPLSGTVKALNSRVRAPIQLLP